MANSDLTGLRRTDHRGVQRPLHRAHVFEAPSPFDQNEWKVRHVPEAGEIGVRDLIGRLPSEDRIGGEPERVDVRFANLGQGILGFTSSSFLTTALSSFSVAS